jgi:hypothetical protein
MVKIIGIDLAGSPRRETGFCVLEEDRIRTKVLKEDEEIIGSTVEEKPELTAIDAPLSLPKGRCCLRDDCPCRGRGHLRGCDRDLIKLKIRFFPLTLGPMRSLTQRGMMMKKVLEQRGLMVVEVYPGGAQDIWGIPRKQKGVKLLRYNLERMGVVGIEERSTHHELDAVTCALVGKLYVEGNFVLLGDPEEGQIVMPRGNVF